jgi:hypothetical protein
MPMVRFMDQGHVENSVVSLEARIYFVIRNAFSVEQLYCSIYVLGFLLECTSYQASEMVVATYSLWVVGNAVLMTHLDVLNPVRMDDVMPFSCRPGNSRAET